MPHEVDAESLIEAGLLAAAHSSSPNQFCTDIVARVLGHSVASGASIMRLSDKAKWVDLGGYGSTLERAQSLDGDDSRDHPDYLAALRVGHIGVQAEGEDRAPLHAIAIQRPFLGVLVVELVAEVSLTEAAVSLLAHATESALGSDHSAGASSMRRIGQQDEPFFSERQMAVLELVAEGKSNTEIGRKLSISASLAKLEVTFLMHALGARNRLDAVVQAQRSGLLPVPQPSIN